MARTLSSGFVDLCSVQLTTTGDPVLAGGNISVSDPALGFDLSIYRDGTRISSGYGDSSVTYYDAPSAGSHNYQLRLFAYEPVTIYACQAFALELNK